MNGEVTDTNVTTYKNSQDRITFLQRLNHALTSQASVKIPSWAGIPDLFFSK